MDFLRRFVFILFGGPRPSEGETEIAASRFPYTSDRYSPSISDVLAVKTHILGVAALPLELIDAIIDFAEYWPHTSAIRSSPTLSVRAGSDQENQFVARSYPLGMVPELEHLSKFRMADRYISTLHSLQPKPWPTSRPFPRSSTQEVLDAWSELSQPRGEFPCRKIVFTLLSHDQGWGGTRSEGIYDGSYTWFEVGKEQLSAFRESAELESWELAPWPQFRLDSTPSKSRPEITTEIPANPKNPPLVCSLRTISPSTIPLDASVPVGDEGYPPPDYIFSHTLLPSDTCLQKNVVADRQAKKHVVTLSCDDCVDPNSAEGALLSDVGRGIASANGEYVRGLKLGDTVSIWAKARFPGWVNIVEEVSIDVYWAV